MLRSLRLALLASTLFVVPAKAEPVTGALAFFAFNAGLGVAATNAIIGVGAFLGSTAGALALSVGGSLIASALAGRPQQQKPSDGQVEIRQSVPARMFHYGRVKVSGPVAFYESRGGDLYKAILLSSRRIDAVERIYLNDEPQTIRSDGGVTSKPSFDSGGDTQGPNIFTQVKLGAPGDNGLPMLRSAFSEWTSNHRLEGQAAISIRCRGVSAETFQTYFPNGEPAVAVLLRGSLLFDPRDGQTRYSDNLGLAILDYLTHPDGYARPIGKLDLPSFIAFANLCDQAVPLAAGGTERRYRVATTISLTEQRKTVLARLLEAGDAQLFPTSDGKTAIRGGRWEAPTVTIDDALGHILETNFAPPDAMSRFNELSIQYLDPALDYVENEGEAWVDVDDQAETGQRITVPLDAVQVPSHSQARRLAKIKMAKDNSDWVGEIVTNLAGLNAIGERVIRLRFSELEIDGPYWVEGVELLPSLTGVKLKLRSANAASYDWTTAEEGVSTSVPPDTSPDLDLDPPVITLSEAAGPRVVATWTPSPAVNRTYQVRIRPQSQPNAWTTMTVAGTRDQATSAVLAGGQSYVVQIRVSAGSQAFGAWSIIYTIAVTGTATVPPPEDFDSLKDGSNNVLLSWRNPNTPAFQDARIFRAAGASATFGSATDLLGPIFGSPNQAMTVTDTPGVGTWRYWVTAESTDGIQSVPVGPETVTIP